MLNLFVRKVPGRLLKASVQFVLDKVALRRVSSENFRFSHNAAQSFIHLQPMLYNPGDRQRFVSNIRERGYFVLWRGSVWIRHTFVTSTHLRESHSLF
jgi:hypothetical protein